MLCLFERLPLSDKLMEEIRATKLGAESCSRQLKAWIKSIQDSDFKGERHVNDKTRRAAEITRQREEFLAELAVIRNKGQAFNN